MSFLIKRNSSKHSSFEGFSKQNMGKSSKVDHAFLILPAPEEL